MTETATSTTSSADGSADAARLFAGAGEMRARCREFDWGATVLGPITTWPSALRTAAQMVLAAGLPNIILWGPELVQIYNDAYADIIRTKHPYALGRGNRDVWPEVWHINGPIFERVFAGETLTFADARFPLARAGPSGETEDVYLTLSFSPIFDETGAVGGVLANMIETTTTVHRRALEAERERLLGALQVEQGRLASVFERAPGFLAVLHGPTHVFTRVNEAYLQLVGHRDVLGKPVSEAIPEAAAQGFIELLDAVLTRGDPFSGREIPIMLQRTPGAPPERRFLDFVYQPLEESDDTGGRRITGIVAHGYDVTAQVVAREAVERAHDRATRLQTLTAMLAASTVPDDVADAIVTQGAAATGAASALLAVRAPASDGQGGELMMLRHLGLDGVPMRDDERFALDSPGPAATCVRLGEAFFCASHEELIEQFPGVRTVWEQLGTQALAAVPLVVAGEAVGAMSFTFREPRAFPHEDRQFFLSLGRQCAQALERARLFAAQREAHRRAEDALAEAEGARERAEVANRAKADFLGVISHELRTPLNAIGGYAELIELGVHGPVTPRQVQALGRIQTSQRHLLGLINSVLNYTRIEAGAVHYDVTSVPLDEVLSTCEALMLPQVRARELTLHYAPCDPLLCARADREKVQQIVLNLLSNAVKFTNPGGRIEMGCRHAEDTVSVYVSDTGRGIPAEQAERVFQPFVQVDARLTRTQEGVGLGLSISRDLARAMEGDLVATSTVGEGSTFTLTLPRTG